MTLFPDRFHLRSGEGTVLAPFCTRACTLNQIDFLSSAYDIFPLRHKQEEQIESSVHQGDEKKQKRNTFFVRQPFGLQKELVSIERLHPFPFLTISEDWHS